MVAGSKLEAGVLDKSSLGIVVTRKILERLFLFLQVQFESDKSSSLVNY